MQFDINRNKPTLKASSLCPNCKEKIIAKCGKVMVWHWAHESLEHCDLWWEPISQWHLDWQSHVPETLTEVIIGEHIADIKLTTGKVIEIQHSSLSVETVQERELFYEDMTWIFDGRDFEERIDFKEKESKSGNTYYKFTFKRPRKYITSATKFPFYIDFANFVFEVKGINTYENTSEEWGDYTSYVFWGYQYNRTPIFYRKIFGKDFVQKTTPSPII